MAMCHIRLDGGTEDKYRYLFAHCWTFKATNTNGSKWIQVYKRKSYIPTQLKGFKYWFGLFGFMAY